MWDKPMYETCSEMAAERGLKLKVFTIRCSTGRYFCKVSDSAGFWQIVIGDCLWDAITSCAFRMVLHYQNKI